MDRLLRSYGESLPNGRIPIFAICPLKPFFGNTFEWHFSRAILFLYSAAVVSWHVESKECLVATARWCSSPSMWSSVPFRVYPFELPSSGHMIGRNICFLTGVQDTRSDLALRSDKYSHRGTDQGMESCWCVRCRVSMSIWTLCWTTLRKSTLRWRRERTWVRNEMGFECRENSSEGWQCDSDSGT